MPNHETMKTCPACRLRFYSTTPIEECPGCHSKPEDKSLPGPWWEDHLSESQQQLCVDEAVARVSRDHEGHGARLHKEIPKLRTCCPKCGRPDTARQAPDENSLAREGESSHLLNALQLLMDLHPDTNETEVLRSVALLKDSRDHEYACADRGGKLVLKLREELAKVNETMATDRQVYLKRADWDAKRIKDMCDALAKERSGEAPACFVIQEGKPFDPGALDQFLKRWTAEKDRARNKRPARSIYKDSVRGALRTLKQTGEAQ